MFSETSLIKDVNIVSKTLSYILVLIMVFICKDNVFLIFVDIISLMITKKYNKLFIFNIFVSILLVLNIFYPHFLWIIKIFLLAIYTILVSKVTKIAELRYIIEITFYGFKNKKLTYKLFYIIYFLKSFKRHFKRMLVLKDEYGIKVTPRFLMFVIKESYLKAKLSKESFIEINNQRFYNYSRTRTYMENITWESWDSNYLLCHILVLAITIFYGR